MHISNSKFVLNALVVFTAAVGVWVFAMISQITREQALGPASLTHACPESTAFKLGDRVRSTSPDTPVAETPGGVIGEQRGFAEGIIIECARRVGDTTWWKVDYVAPGPGKVLGPDGWTPQRNLLRIDSTALPSPPPFICWARTFTNRRGKLSDARRCL